MKEHVIINRDRTVIVPESLKKIGIQFDHNVNTITFDCPRYPDEDPSIDMSQMPIFINYMLPDKTPGSSLALNVTVDETDNTLMHFDWKITNAITPVNGVLSTLICVKQSDTEGNELYHWNTDLFQKFTVGNGMECNEHVAEMNPDVISQLLARMGEVDTRTSAEAMSGYINEYMTENPPQPTDEQVGSGVNTYMASNGQTHVNTYMASNGQTHVNTYMTSNGQTHVDAYMTENQELVQNSVDDYLGRNPLQLDDSLTDSTKAAPADKVGELKSDIANSRKAIAELADKKITKFYANSLGETTLNDSDNGKIQDMILYGKSLQDGTPTPDAPVEIQSVVNPVVKVCGGTLRSILSDFQWNWLKDNESKWHNNNTTVWYEKNNRTLFVLNKSDITSTGFYLYTILSNQYYSNTQDVNDWANNNYMANNTHKHIYLEHDGIFINSENTVGLPNNNCSATLPYTLNAIPVDSGGNVTIDGQEYIADYVDIENKKLVRMTEKIGLSYSYVTDSLTNTKMIICSQLLKRKVSNNHIISNVGKYKYPLTGYDNLGYFSWYGSSMNNVAVRVPLSMTSDEFNSLDVYAIYELTTPSITDLTDEELQTFKELATYYPTTNVIVTSDQLDGYAKFNYPLSMDNGWNLIKEQLGDTREYIYDMELQSAEAYVNSEYAVTLTELGV